jgi:hypothetical protein
VPVELCVTRLRYAQIHGSLTVEWTLKSDFDTVIQNTVHHQLVTARQKALGTTDVP